MVLEVLTTIFVYALPWHHLPNNPINSVPDAETQGQHDSWSAQWRLFEFPGKDSYCQEAKDDAYDFGDQFIYFPIQIELYIIVQFVSSTLCICKDPSPEN